MAPVGYLETSVLYCDDNLHRLAQFPDECIDLIYLDPPFFSNRHYEVIWGDEAEIRSFEDRWEGGINVYINWMRERVIEMHRILKPDGVIFLHCDYHAGHYLKVMLDDIFGQNRLQNEIIWCYRGGGVPRDAFARKHDTIYFYAKGRQHFFDPQFVPYSQASRDLVESRGGVSIDDLPRDVERGAHMPDWWVDINSLQTWSPERRGYPTQKPEALLDRIIRSASRPDAVVLDPFCGCGTAVIVAHKLGRQWIGIDISPTAVDVIRRELARAGADRIKIVGMPVTEDDLRRLKPFEFQNWVINRFNGTHAPRQTGDMGIDGFSFMVHDPIQVKQSDHVGRNVIDNFETAIERADRQAGYVVAFSFTSGAREEAARTATTGATIRLVTVADLLADTTDLITPQRGTLDLGEGMEPPPPARPADSRPSVDELIESNRRPTE